MPITPYVRLLRRNPSFTRLYAAQLASFAGDWFATVALLGLALELTGSTSVASLVLVLQMAPFFFLSPFAGVLADRLDRRRLMIAADVARAVIALGFLLARDPSTMWLALVAVALLSGCSAFFEPTSSASLPNLVDEEDLPRANVLIGAAWGTMLAVGAAVGGLVAVLFGRDVAFLINSASFAVSAVLIYGIRRSFRAPGTDSPDEPPLSATGPQDAPVDGAPQDGAGVGTAGRAPQDAPRGAEPVQRPGAPQAPRLVPALAETLALARRSRPVAALLLVKSTFGVGVGVVLLLAVFARDVFGAGDLGIGLLFAARGLGALLGPFLGRAVAGADAGRLFTGIALSLVAYIGSYLLVPLAPSIWFASVFVFTAHLGGGAQWTLSSYGLQVAVPDAIRGRVFGFDYTLLTLTAAASTLLAGVLAAPLGAAATLYLLMGFAAVASALWLVWTVSLWRPRAAPDRA